jgi:signal transduction histidine kinase
VFAASLVVMFNGGVGVTRHGVDASASATVLLVGAASLSLVARRRFSVVTVFIAASAATAALSIAVFPIGLPLAPAVALYWVALQRARPRWSMVALVGVCFVGYLVASGIQIGAVPWAEGFHGVLLWSALWLAGERARLRREQIEDLKRYAVRERHLAASEERARIARDLHDSVGHAINVIAVRAGAARLRHGEDPNRSLVALVAIEELARQTVADIDHLVGALRSGVTRSRYRTASRRSERSWRSTPKPGLTSPS